jgi:membrane protein implicated in regulation of membrane protease activity
VVVDFWHWWVLAVVLVVIEIIAPGTAYFIWMGVAAGITGVVLMLAPALSWEWQLLIFSVFSIASIVLWRLYAKRNPVQTDEPHLNRRGEQYIGRTFTLTEPIVNGLGKLRVDDTTWRIESNDLPAGTRVRVTGVNGTILRVTGDG